MFLVAFRVVFNGLVRAFGVRVLTDLRLIAEGAIRKGNPQRRRSSTPCGNLGNVKWLSRLHWAVN